LIGVVSTVNRDEKQEELLKLEPELKSKSKTKTMLNKNWKDF
jgi:hypothetical protein